MILIKFTDNLKNIYIFKLYMSSHINGFRNYTNEKINKTMQKSQLLNVGGGVVIKRDFSNENQTNLINPIKRETTTKLLNINSRFRQNYYNTKSSDFTFELPQVLKNVTKLTIISVQIPKSHYSFSSNLGTNEFNVELFDMSANGTNIANNKKVNVKILEGEYNASLLENYLNNYVFTKDSSLNRIACKIDEITRKFRFFRDYRSDVSGGVPESTDDVVYGFNLDWRLQENLERPIALNMGWILGYRKQYCEWNRDYVDSSNVSYSKQEGYNPEGVYNNVSTKYFILSINDFNNNYGPSLLSPFQESSFTDENTIAKIPLNPSSTFEDIFFQSKRTYFGPVNIKRLHIKLLDEHGRVVDLNNTDFALSIQIDQLYDGHVNK